ncbi:hypothetical protein DPM19_00035 [Actinomadura craniellae]|uniref:Uncharacterized protein n=2 Tax=Actinomadura craniellae TaxID=2231787 RepID=A0A365HBX3_9ACTN|nr:hypothetical protein DPM19_00035 [Actinomadura craniellae]
MRRIGLWGAPTSGKTSFLAALNIAVTQSSEEWTIFGVDDPSVDFLVDSTTTLTHERRFPPATEALSELSWILMSETEVEIGTRRRKETKKIPLELHLDVLDAPGRVFGHKPKTDAHQSQLEGLGFDDEDEGMDGAGGGSELDEEKLIDNLADCDGIVYLFDPIREREKGDAFQYFQRTLALLAKRSLEGRRLINGRLPHHFAVCITKFDEPRVYQTAKARGYITFDPDDKHMFPKVHPDNAENLFEDLCQVASAREAALVHGSIKRYFRPERVRYFATSAVGFYLAPRTVRFRASDYQNVVPDGGEGYRIRGDIHPINVLEPLLWLGRQLSSETGR